MSRRLTAWGLTLATAMGVIGISPIPSSAGNLYSAWPAGPPQDPNYFPIAVWYQAPGVTGAYGKYGSQVAAVAGEHMNTFVAFGAAANGQAPWPERFGADAGELEAIKAAGLYAVGGLAVPSSEDLSADSVASMLALAKSIDAEANLIGYNMGDEPDCATMASEPAVVAKLQSYDPTRIVAWNQAHWMSAPSFSQCLSVAKTALQASSLASTDFYPLTDPYIGGVPNVPLSDFLSVPNDTLFIQGIVTQALIHFGSPGQPVWVFVESGSDTYGLSSTVNYFTGGVTSGSTTLTNASHWSKFTAAWIGLQVSGTGIPPKTTITAITDNTHAIMSAPAAATNAKATVTVTGAGDNDCFISLNLCVAQGNEYRATPVQVNAEAWMSIINGANGIEYFCHDSSSTSYCLGDSKVSGSGLVQNNLTYVNSNISAFSPELNAPTIGMCSMQLQNYTTSSGWSTTTSCSNGTLTMSTTNAQVPGMALAKQYNGVTYLFVQSDRRSPYGANFNFCLAGLGSKTAKVVYDLNARYDPTHSDLGTTFALTANGSFTTTLGANNDDYQVKIYTIQ